MLTKTTGILFTAACAALMVLLLGLSACLGVGEGPKFIDESLIELQDPFGVSIGDFCRATPDCVDGLRCVTAGGEQYCVETCRDNGQCDEGDCNAVSNGDNEGWCALDGDLDDYADFGEDDGGDFDDDDNNFPPTDPDPDPAPVAGCGSAVESRQLELLNQDRVAQGLSALRCDPRLAEVAREHSRDMFERDFFDHTNPSGEAPWDRMDRHGIAYRGAGENIAVGYPTPEAVEEGWMDSPGHRANILNDGYTHVGVGVFDGGGQLFWTQLFATF